ncbi:MAG: helix-turn-helix domain-containing protein, partial [Phycisphaeraceae bacterium]|nr:helix-turn-helix domain-containing protein [Phycisphaeraceae bacterium]
LIFHVFGALAEFERDIIKERTLAGLAAARARGRKGGRPRKLSKKQVEMAKRLMNDPTIPIEEICKTMAVSKATLYRHTV